MSSDHLLQQAITALRAGDKPAARKILTPLVRQEPENAQAWYLLSQVVEKKEQAVYCLEQVLKLSPENPSALRRLQRLQSPAPSQQPDSIPTPSPQAKPQITSKKSSKKYLKLLLLMVGVIFILCLGSAGLIAVIELNRPPPNTSIIRIETISPSLMPLILATLTHSPTNTPYPTHDPAAPPAVASGPASCVPSAPSYQMGVVTEVVDGDTIKVSIDGTIYSIRYIGIDAPETNNPETGIEYFGPESTAKNRELVANKVVLLARDISEIDRYGRVVRYVFVDSLDGLFVNYELVREGYALTVAFPPDTSCYQTFLQAEQSARLAQIGFFAPIPFPSLTPIVHAPTAPGGEIATTGKISITSIFYNGTKGNKEPDEYVEIRNNVAFSIQLSGWTLRDDADHVFTFPAFTMQSGQVCRVYTNEIHPESCGFSFNFTSSAIWNNSGDCAYLKDNQGNLISNYCY